MDCVRVRRRVLVEVPVTTWVEEILVETVGEPKAVLLTLPLREGVFDVVVLCVRVFVVLGDEDRPGVFVVQGVEVVVFDEEKEDVCVTEDVVLGVWADDALNEEDPVLVDVGLGARVTLALPVQLGDVVEEEVREGEEEGDPDTLRVLPVVAEIRGDPDTVTVPPLFDTVDDALGEGVDD